MNHTADTMIKEAKRLFNDGAISDAVSILDGLITESPEHLEGLFLLGESALKMRNPEKAIVCFNRIIKQNPESCPAYKGIASAFNLMGRFDMASACYRHLLKSRPNNLELLNCLALSLRDNGENDEAIHVFSCARDRYPNAEQIHYNLGITYMSLGKKEEAISCFKETLRINPRTLPAYKELSDLIKPEEIDGTIAALEKLDIRSLPFPDNVSACNALGKLSEKKGEYSRAFEYFEEGNRIRSKIAPISFDPHAFKKSIEIMISVFDESFFTERERDEVPTERMVFIVGLPRSGTSLVEQILSSHSDVFGAGELHHVGSLAREFLVEAESMVLTREAVGRITPEKTEEKASLYLERIREMAGNEKRVIDKMPHNYLYLWMIAIMFPKARIIHCRRGPADNCLSMFCTDFAVGNEFTFDLSHLGTYYQTHTMLMDHWKKMAPLKIMTVNYEELVNAQESVSKALIDFLGLKWEDQCLSFHQNSRMVRTASLLQVREKMYSSSIGRWKQYEKHLTPLFEALGPDLCPPEVSNGAR